MTLHKTIEITRKFIIGVFIGVAAIFVFMLIFRLGVIIKNIISPPKTIPANHLYGVLPSVSFPQDPTSLSFTYELNTVTGELPQFPDRINVYPIQEPNPSLLDLNNAKEKVKKIGFVNESDVVLPETSLGDGNYAWAENKGIGRRITLNIVSSDFSLESNFLSSPFVLQAQNLSNQENAKNQIADFMKLLDLSTDDIDLAKTNFELFSIQNGILVPETNLTRAKVIRADLQQKPLEYELNTGIPDLAGGFKKQKMTVPFVYSYPPHTTMSFSVASGEKSAEVVKADFIHKTPKILDKDMAATYYIKTANEALDELKDGKAYIAAYKGDQANISINNVYLAYYIDENVDQYFMPVIVFEGDNGFAAYVSAIKTEWVK